MKILRELEKLFNEGVIDQATLVRIKAYYQSRQTNDGNRLITIFGVIGALLIGLGIILVLAHNWDDLSKTIKLGIALIPTICAQILCFYIFRRKLDLEPWRESGTTFLLLAIGASISLVAQIYNMPSDMEQFLMTWMLLVVPLIYLMRSSFASLLYLIGITWMGWIANDVNQDSYWFWLLLLFVLPKYIYLWISNDQRNYLLFHHWLVVIAVLSNLWAIGSGDSFLLFILYLSVLAVFYHIGQRLENPIVSNAYLLAGSIGTAIILLAWSFDFLWIELFNDITDGEKYSLTNLVSYSEFWWSIVIIIIHLLILFFRSRSDKYEIADLNHWAFLILALGFVIASGQPDFARILMNLFILALAVSKIKRGVDRDSLLILNYGLLLIATLITCRFFDTEMSFVLRGILFMAVGAGFFIANYFLINRRREHD